MNLRAVFLFSALLAAASYGQGPADTAWAKLTLGVEDKNADSRARAVFSLGLIPDNEKAAALAERGLTDESEKVRAAAATALGQMGAKSSAPKLKAAVRDQDVAVVFAAANALLLIGDPTAYEVYYAVLAGEKKTGDSLLESQTKMIKDPKAIAKVGFEQGIGFIPFGGASYAAFKMMTKDDVSPVRAAAAVKLIRDPDPRTQKLLDGSVADKKWLVRAAAIDTLAKRDNPAAIPAITNALDDDNEVVRYTAAAAIVRLSSFLAK